MNSMAVELGLRTLTLVAAALSEEYGVSVTAGGNQAYTLYPRSGGKPTINIPALSAKDKNYLPLCRGYIDHEVGHVRFTTRYELERISRPGASAAAVKVISNIFEDVYVERVMGECFPGCKRNLKQMVRIVFEEDAEEPVDAVAVIEEVEDSGDTDELAGAIWKAIFQHILYQTRRVPTPELEELAEQYAAPLSILTPGLADLMQPVIDRVSVEGINTKANIELAEEVERIILDYMQKNKQEMQESWGGKGQGQSEELQEGAENQPQQGAGGSKQGEGDPKEGEEENSASGGQQEGQEEGQEAGQFGGQQDSQDDGQNAGQNQANSSDSTESDGQNAGQDSGQQQDQSGSQQAGQGASNIDVDEAINKARWHAKHTKEDGGTDISERAAESMKEQADKEGVPDAVEMRKNEFGGQKWGHFVSEMDKEDVKKSMAASAALDAQLQALLQTYVLNRSGMSRAGRLDTNVLHRLVIGNSNVFRRRVEKRGIDTEIVISVDMSGSMGWENKDEMASQALLAIMHSLRKIPGVKSSVYGFAGRQSIDILRPQDKLTTKMQIQPNGGTLCGEALAHAAQQFSSNPMSHKIVLMITDGETDNSRYFREVIKSLRQAKVEFLGIGIMDRALGRYLQPEEFCHITDLKQLAPEMFRMLQNKLLGGA